MAELTGVSDAVRTVLREAEAARAAAEGKPYVSPGVSPDQGFDCSGFVRYVFNRAFRLDLQDSADGLMHNASFPAVTSANRAPGDLIFFGRTRTHATHVAIVMDDTRFLGSQSSTGVAYVRLTNPYWQPLIIGYGRYTGLQGANATIPLRAGSIASPIAP